MRKNLFLTWLVASSFFCIRPNASAQVIFSEDWSSNSFTTNGWTFPSGQAYWGLSVNGVPGAALPAASFYPINISNNYSYDLVSPVINASSYAGGALFLSYKLFFISNNNPSTIEQFVIEYKSTTSSTWFVLTNYTNIISSFNIAPTNVLLPGMASQNFQIRFRAYGANTLSIDHWSLDDINIAGVQPCFGSPNPGNTLATSTSLCPGTSDTLSLQNITGPTVGLTFQWMKSSSPSGPFIAISGATNSTYVITPLSGSSITYWCNVTCINSGISTASTPITITVAGWSPTSPCYCISQSSSTQDEEIYNVSLNGSSTNTLYSYTNGCTTVAPGPGSILSEYSSFKTLAPLSTLTQGMAASFSIVQDECNGTPYFQNRIGIWIDYNHNASFYDPGEQVYFETSGTMGPRTATGNFVIPATSLSGVTVMRIVCADVVSSLSPCGIYAYGETEDYLVNIAPIFSCSGAPTPGNTVASATTICTGGAVTLSLQNTTPGGSTIQYQWYDNVGAIAGATNQTYSTTCMVSDTFYCAVTCINAAITTNSTPVVVTVNATSSGSSSISGCSVYTWNGNTYSVSGIYTATFTNAAGCDSVHTLNLTLNSTPPTIQSQTACDFYLWSQTGITYTNSGMYTSSYTNASGCDSNTVLNLIVNSSSSFSINQTACDFIVFNSQTYTSSGVYTNTMTNASGCDSIITLNATVYNSSTSMMNQSDCDSIVLNNQTYTASGMYTQLFTNMAGCDSIIILNATINHSFVNINQTACDSILLNGQTYTTSGTYMQTYTNALGCDSIITLNATIHYGSSFTTNVTVCDSIMLGGATYTTSGTYTSTFTNAVGCDSTITINSTINNSSNSTINQTGCDSITFNSQTYTLSGVYTGTYTTASGCDSILTLNIALNYINLLTTLNGVTITTNAPGLSYQWIDCGTNTILSGATDQSYTATANGSYAVIISGGAACFDTSACTIVSTVGVSEINNANNYFIYPNPNHGLFMIELKSDAEIIITNALGEVVFSEIQNKGKQKINISNNADGIYFLKIKSNGNDGIIKLLKE